MLALPLRRSGGWLLLAFLVLLAPAPGVAVPQLPRAQTPFRAGVRLVPVDVRVVDAQGHPVTDLTAADFTVFENGVRQQVVHFARHADPGLAPSEGATSGPMRRTFFIVLGRGRLNAAGHGLDALIDFVGSLLADDRVAVLAYLHLSELTTDHAAVVRLLERYKAQHELIEAALAADSARALGAPAWPLSPETQAAIQAVFEAPELPAVQRFPGAAGGRGLQFSDRVALRRMLEYLRHVEGEKYLVLLVDGTQLRGGVDAYAAAAAAARVSVWVVQTGGVPGGRPGRLWAAPSRSPAVFDATSLAVDVAGLRALARQTGGYATFYQDAGDAFMRLTRIMSVQYLLGYYPVEPPRDGEARRLQVAVNRRNLTVLHRHEYHEPHSTLDKRPPDLRALFAESRFRSLLASPPPTSEVAPSAWSTIPTKLSAARIRGSDAAEQVRVDLAIDPRWVTFTRAGCEYLLSLDLAVAVHAAGGRPLGDFRDRIELRLDAEAYRRLLRERIRHTVVVDVTSLPAEVKVVVCEYTSNRGALVTQRLR